jgi:membrane protease YdiL (CAAX protease family)
MSITTPRRTFESPLSPKRWPADAFGLVPTLFFVLILGAAFFASLTIQAIILHFDPASVAVLKSKNNRLTPGLLWVQAAGYVPLLIAVVYGLPLVARRSLRELGLAPPSGKQILTGIGGAAVMLAVVELAAAGQRFATHVESHEKVVDMVASIDNPGLLAGLVLLACVLAPIVEELIFRGFFFNAALRFAPPLVAAALSAVLFGLAHFEPSALFPLACGGFVLALVYYRTGSLVSSMISHALFNATNVVLVLFAHTTS